MTTRYAAAHETPNGPNDARPTALQIIRDNNLVGKLPNDVALVTGVSSGLGVETVKALQATGMRVFGTARDMAKAKEALGEALDEPNESESKKKAELLYCDLTSLDSVCRCAAEFLQKSSGKCNILINNAGVMMTPDRLTADQHELQFGTNHLAHFLLFQLVKPALLASATPTHASRVVATSSTGHRLASKIHFDNLALRNGAYDANLAYGQSKLANVYFANEVNRRYASRHLHAFSCHPGGIWTGLQKYIPAEQMQAWKNAPGVDQFMKSTEQGAATQVFGAVDASLEGRGGVYLEDCGVAKVLEDVQPGDLVSPGVAAWAFDEGVEGKLWEVSCDIVGEGVGEKR